MRGSIARRFRSPSVLTGIGSFSWARGSAVTVTVRTDSVGRTRSHRPGATRAAGTSPVPASPASASARGSASRAVSGCAGISSCVSARASGSPTSRIAGHQPGRPGRAVTIAARGTATQFSSNSGQNSGA